MKAALFLPQATEATCVVIRPPVLSAHALQLSVGHDNDMLHSHSQMLFSVPFTLQH